MLDAGTPPLNITKHGSAGYRRGCRCTDCRAGVAARERRRYRDRTLGRDTRNRTPQAAMQALAKLRDTGMSWPDIEAATGIGTRNLQQLAAGERVYITAVTEHAITRALNGDTRLAPTTRVPATGAARRIQGLNLLGWNMRDIAKEAGVSVDTISRVAHNRSSNLQHAMNQAITAATKALVRRRPPEGRYAAGTRTRARQHGWTPLMEWDDIDNPHEQPATPVPRTRLTVDEELVARVWRLRGQGWTDQAIADEIGYRTASAVCKLRQRHPNPQED